MIYATAFDLEADRIEASQTTGFETLDQVVEIVGEPKLDQRPAFVVYEGVLFSRIQWSIDAQDSTA